MPAKRSNVRRMRQKLLARRRLLFRLARKNRGGKTGSLPATRIFVAAA